MIYLIIGALIALVAVIFGLQNSGEVTVHFLAWKLQGSLGLILLITFLLGILASFFTYLPKMLKSHRTIRKLKRQLKKNQEASDSSSFDFEKQSSENKD